MSPKMATSWLYIYRYTMGHCPVYHNAINIWSGQPLRDLGDSAEIRAQSGNLWRPIITIILWTGLALLLRCAASSEMHNHGTRYTYIYRLRLLICRSNNVVVACRWGWWNNMYLIIFDIVHVHALVLHILTFFLHL